MPEATSTYGSDFFQFPLDISPSVFKRVVSKFTVLSREGRDHKFTLPVVLVPMAQEWLHVA
jgi:hypothetical protein